MRLILQRALNASVSEVPEGGGDELPLGAIDCGFVVLVGFGQEDSPALPESRDWHTQVEKILTLRVFPDAQGKMNLSLLDYAATCPDKRCGVLLVSQFTLYADCSRGRRPSFTPAAPPALAERLYLQLAHDLRQTLGHNLQCGRFGADMRLTFTNWGPVTIGL